MFRQLLPLFSPSHYSTAPNLPNPASAAPPAPLCPAFLLSLHAQKLKKAHRFQPGESLKCSLSVTAPTQISILYITTFKLYQTLWPIKPFYVFRKLLQIQYLSDLYTSATLTTGLKSGFGSWVLWLLG